MLASHNSQLYVHRGYLGQIPISRFYGGRITGLQAHQVHVEKALTLISSAKLRTAKDYLHIMSFIYTIKTDEFV